MAYVSQRVFHVFGEKNCLCQEVTLRCGVTTLLACIADYRGIKLSSVMIQAGISPEQVAGSVGVLWATMCTPRISIVTNALATYVAPTAIHIHSKYRQGRSLNNWCSTLFIVLTARNAIHPICL